MIQEEGDFIILLVIKRTWVQINQSYSIFYQYIYKVASKIFSQCDMNIKPMSY